MISSHIPSQTNKNVNYYLLMSVCKELISHLDAFGSLLIGKGPLTFTRPPQDWLSANKEHLFHKLFCTLQLQTLGV